ncbi:MAG: response regulator [bacterium]|nr:response regulator [bacterium]
MSIRKRLALSFLMILGLFGLNILIYGIGSWLRSDGFQRMDRAVRRQLLVAEIAQDFDQQRRNVLMMGMVLVDSDLEPEEIERIKVPLHEIKVKIGDLRGLTDPADRDDVASFAGLYQRVQEEWISFYESLERGKRPPVPEPPPPADAEAAPAEPAEGEAAELPDVAAPAGIEPPATDAADAASPDPSSESSESLADSSEPDQAGKAHLKKATEKLGVLKEKEDRRVKEATAELSRIDELVNRITRLIFGLSTIVAIVVAVGFSIHLNRGLRSLKTGVGLIGGGDLDHRIEIRHRDELGDLAEAFNEMSEKLLRSRAKVEEARAAAEQANQAKSTFLANMSHELRTPMNAILGYTEMLLEDAEELGQEETVPDLQKILAAGKHLLALINDVLDLSKIEAGKMTLFLETFEVATLVDDVTATISPLVAKNTNTLEVDVGPDVGTMTADETKVRQTMFNLLSNACKFTKEGTIAFGVQREILAGADGYLFAVRDTGIGMSPEQMEKVFDEFTQADSSTTRKFGGTGLGLSISKKFCRLMGGDIRVESELGRGTTFTVELPAVVTEKKGEPDKPAAGLPAPSDGTGTATVLVIDDDTAALDLTRRFLTKEGFSVVTATDGEKGLELAREIHPRAITLDVMMPGMDGWTVLSALKQDPATAEIPVIMLTMLDERQRGFALGASEYLCKPVDRERLAALLQHFRGDQETGGRVLVVEDDADTRKLIRRNLKKAGWSVDEAKNGRAGLERVGKAMPDLILLDLMMPEMDGFEFLRELRAREAWQQIPVVVVTAKEITEQERLRLNGWVEKVLHKGAYGRENLLGEIRDLVRACTEREPPDEGEA